jgi:predicted outer membrane repeat protein
MHCTHYPLQLYYTTFDGNTAPYRGGSIAGIEVMRIEVMRVEVLK